MPLAPIPVQRFLVPDTRPQAPEGFTSIDQPIVDGLPHVVALGGGLSLALVVPTGLATLWRDVDPSSVVSSSEPELSPAAEAGAGEAPRTPARLFLRIGGTVASSIPLAVGLRRAVPEAGDSSGVRLEVVVLSWDIRAGSLRGPGDFGSRIAVATRRADQAGDTFETPAVHPQLVARLRGELRAESELGRR
jgi:hypothetical protein